MRSRAETSPHVWTCQTCLNVNPYSESPVSRADQDRLVKPEHVVVRGRAVMRGPVSQCLRCQRVIAHPSILVLSGWTVSGPMNPWRVDGA